MLQVLKDLGEDCWQGIKGHWFWHAVFSIFNLNILTWHESSSPPRVGKKCGRKRFTSDVHSRAWQRFTRRGFNFKSLQTQKCFQDTGYIQGCQECLTLAVEKMRGWILMDLSSFLRIKLLNFLGGNKINCWSIKIPQTGMIWEAVSSSVGPLCVMCNWSHLCFLTIASLMEMEILLSIRIAFNPTKLSMFSTHPAIS